MDIKNLDWNISSQTLASSLQGVTIRPDYVYGKCLFWGKECRATFKYPEGKALKVIEFSVLGNKESGPGTEGVDFRKIFNLLKELLGEPQQYINITQAQIEQLKDVYKELKYEKLPRIIWEIDDKRVVHRFKDHWGMIPDTYIEKI